jgi:hypothetical protein
MEENKMLLGDPSSSAVVMMKQLADNTPDVPMDINGDELIDRTKLFVVAYARNQLNRIIKLTNFLERLEDKFITAVSERIESEPESLTMISMAMETISKCLEDANSVVFQVLKDDRLQNIIINTTNIITPDGNSATIIDADSRDEVRNLAESLLAQLSKISEENSKNNDNGGENNV